MRILLGITFLLILTASSFSHTTATTVVMDPWLQWASIAWRYYQPGVGVDSVSGLHSGTLDWHYFTDWDLGSYVCAIVDAEALGLLQRAGAWGADYRLDKVLSFLETRALRSEDGLPYWAYRSADGSPGTDQSRLNTDKADQAMLLVSLDHLRIARPDLATRISSIVNRTRQAYDTTFQWNGNVKSGFYEYFYGLAYAAFGFNVSTTLREIQTLNGLGKLDVYGQMLPETDITSEPILLTMLYESDRVDPLFKEYAFDVYRAQEARYNATGTLTAWSEGAIDVAPYYQYEWVVHVTGETSPMVWDIVGPSQSDIASGKTPIIYTKAALALDALYSTAYTRTLAEKVLPLTQTGSGFREGIREKTGEAIGNEGWPVQDKTNSMIIAAARYALITAPTVKSTTVTVNYQGNGYTASIQTNASTTNPHFDPDRGLFNFTFSGEDGSVGSFAVTIPKPLLKGTPVVIVDNARIASTYTENSTHYFVHFEYALSIHTATVEGSNAIPEFPSAFFVPAATLALIVLIALVLKKRRKKGKVQLVNP